MDVGVFHPGTQHSWQTARALQELGKLSWYATSIYYRPDRLPYSLIDRIPGRLGSRARGEVHRFVAPGLDPRKVRTAGAEEWLERAAFRLGLKGLAARLDQRGNDRFAQKIAGDAAREQVMLWGYNGSSAAAFADPRLAILPKVLDRTIGDWRYWNRLQSRLRERWPEWGSAIEGPIPQAVIARDDAEYDKASLIVCGSPFVARTIAQESNAPAVGKKLRILPYCHDEALFGGAPPPAPATPGRPVRFLFVGHLSLRKGLPELLHALERIPAREATLTLVGPRLVQKAALSRFADRVDYRGAVARSEIPAIMQAHDVLVLPSHFEGSAITLIEARASGLAVIQTRAAGLGADAESGIVLDECEIDGIADAMASMVRDRERLLAMRMAAWNSASRHGFAAYRSGVGAIISELAG